MPTSNPTGAVPSVVNAVLPFLTGTAAGNGLLSCGGVCWRFCDSVFGVDNRDPARASANAKAVAVFTQVSVKSAEAYATAFAAYAEEAQAKTAGVRCMFSFMDDEKPGTALQLAWYDGPDVLDKVPRGRLAALIATYEPSATNFALVFGGHTSSMKASLESTMPGVKVEYGASGRGFMRDMESYGPSGTPYKNPPMIWVSKRYTEPGRGPNSAKAFQKAADLQYESAPGFYASYEFTAKDNPDLVWSLRFFGDYHEGHIAHFPKVIFSWIPARVLFTVLPELKRFGVGGFEYAVSFSTKEDIDAAINWNFGNKAYTQYTWDKGLIGPMPDFMQR